MTDEELKRLKKVCEDATPEDKWTGTGNYPFYVILEKPAPSLSKHEGTPRAARMWRYQDGAFILEARRAMPKLIEEVERLSNEHFELYQQREAAMVEIQRLQELYDALALATGNQ